MDEMGNVVVPEAPRTAGPELGSFAQQQPQQQQQQTVHPRQSSQAQRLPADKKEEDSHPTSRGATLEHKFGTLIRSVRGDSEKRHGGASKRQSILGGLVPRPSGETERGGAATSINEKENVHVASSDAGAGDAEKDGAKEKARAPSVESEKPAASIVSSQSQPIGTPHRRAATILDSAGRATRHERRSSTSAAIFSGGTIGRRRRPSTGATGVGPARGAVERMFGRTEETDEEGGETPTVERTDDEVMRAAGRGKDEDDGHQSEKEFKPIFAKGLFRWALTYA
jgi:serine/threonine protein kinase KIN1/2